MMALFSAVVQLVLRGAQQKALKPAGVAQRDVAVSQIAPCRIPQEAESSNPKDLMNAERRVE